MTQYLLLFRNFGILLFGVGRGREISETRLESQMKIANFKRGFSTRLDLGVVPEILLLSITSFVVVSYVKSGSVV